jgi:hypothetical protein
MNYHIFRSVRRFLETFALIIGGSIPSSPRQGTGKGRAPRAGPCLAGHSLPAGQIYSFKRGSMASRMPSPNRL